MFCGKCGSKLPDGAKFCSKCGAKMDASLGAGGGAASGALQGGERIPQRPYQSAQDAPRTGAYQAEGSAAPSDTYQPPAGQVAPRQNTYHTGSVPPYSDAARRAEEYPMGWYKFLIWVALFATALTSFIYAIIFFTGSYWGGGWVTDVVYSYIPGLRAVDVLTGLMLLGVTAYALVVRFRLSGFKASGPKSLLVLYVVDVCVWFFWLIGVLASTTAATDNMYGMGGTLTAAVAPSFVGAFVICGGMIAWNYDYFKKRASLFVN